MITVAFIFLHYSRLISQFCTMSVIALHFTVTYRKLVASSCEYYNNVLCTSQRWAKIPFGCMLLQIQDILKTNVSLTKTTFPVTDTDLFDMRFLQHPQMNALTGSCPGQECLLNDKHVFQASDIQMTKYVLEVLKYLFQIHVTEYTACRWHELPAL